MDASVKRWSGKVRDLGGQVFVELGVVGEYRDQRGGGRLGLVAVPQVLDEACAGLGGPHQQDAQRLRVECGRGVLDQLVDGGDLFLADRLVGEGVRGAGVAEQQVLCGLVEGEVFVQLGHRDSFPFFAV